MTRFGLFALAPLALLAGCQADTGASDAQSLVRLKNQTNIATLLLGDANGIPGVFKDIQNMSGALGGTDLNFKIVGKDMSEPPANQGSSRQDIFNTAAKAATAVGEGGTYLFYQSSHGSEDGSIIASDGGYYFSEVASAIKAARKNVAITRGIVFVDACYSGNLTGSGQASVQTTLRDERDGQGYGLAPGAPGVANLPDVNVDDERVSRIAAALEKIASQIVEAKQGTFDELIVIASSSAAETSGDSEGGGVGTLAFKAAMDAAKQNPNMKIREFLEKVKGGAMGQTPVFKTVPDSLLDQTVLGADEAGATGPASTTASGAATTGNKQSGQSANATAQPTQQQTTGAQGGASGFSDLIQQFMGGGDQQP